MPAVAELLRLAHQREHDVHVGDDRRDHRDADAAVGFLAHEVGEPAVVRAAAGDRLVRVVGRAGQAGAERRRRDPAGAEHVGVGEQHLGGDAFLVEHRVARGRSRTRR